MPFEKLEFDSTATKATMATVSYMPTAGRGRNVGIAGKRPRLIIFVPKTICGTTKASTFALQLGSGNHAGKLRIVGGHDDKDVKPAELKYALRFNFGFIPRLGNDMFGAERLPLRKVSDDVFEIDVIAQWFEPDAAGDE